MPGKAFDSPGSPYTDEQIELFYRCAQSWRKIERLAPRFAHKLEQLELDQEMVDLGTEIIGEMSAATDALSILEMIQGEEENA